MKLDFSTIMLKRVKQHLFCYFACVFTVFSITISAGWGPILFNNALDFFMAVDNNHWKRFRSFSETLLLVSYTASCEIPMYSWSNRYWDNDIGEWINKITIERKRKMKHFSAHSVRTFFLDLMYLIIPSRIWHLHSHLLNYLYKLLLLMSNIYYSCYCIQPIAFPDFSLGYL